MSPNLSNLLKPDPTVDLVGIFFSFVIPSLIALLAFSRRAQQAAEMGLNLFRFVRAFMDQYQKTQKRMPISANGSGNGNGHTNGNGNGNGGASDQLKLVLNNLRVEADARESGDQSIAQRLDNLSERGRRDSDNFYMLYSELSRDSKKHGEDIVLLKAENAKVNSQLEHMIREQQHTNEQLDTLMQILRPPPPTPPGKEIIPLDDEADDGLQKTG